MDLLQGNNREKSKHCQAASKSYYFCCDRIRRSAILNKLTIGEHQKHIVSRGSLHVSISWRCFMKNKSSETPESAAFPILCENINYCCCCRNRRLGMCGWVLAGASTLLELIMRTQENNVDGWAYALSSGFNGSLGEATSLGEGKL